MMNSLQRKIPMPQVLEFDEFVKALEQQPNADAKPNGSANGRRQRRSRDNPDPGDHGGESAWCDPDWSILDDRRGELPEFPLEVLTDQCRDWVERAAHGAGATPAHVAVPMLSIASGLIGTARRVQASRSWTQPMTFWSAIVGFSGTSKTPGIDAAKRALDVIQRLDRSKIAEQQLKHHGRAEAAKATKARWKEELKNAAKGEVVFLSSYS